QRMFAVMERLAASSNLQEILTLIIDSMRDSLRAERASVFQFDAKAQELFITQAHGAVGFRFPITKGIAGEAARSKQIINVPDAWEDPRFNSEFDKKSGFRTRALLTIPLLSFDGGLEGVAQVLNKCAAEGATAIFDPSDELLARALASQAAIALRRARLIEAELRKNKIEGDLKIARTIQTSSLPKSIPVVRGYDIAAQTEPAEETGGDTYDLIDVSALNANPEGPVRKGLVIVMADATGHGIGPAISVTQAKSMIRMGARLGAGIDRVAEQLNAQLCDDLPAGRFITAFIGLLDPEAHTITYAAPGQAPLLLVRADGSVEERSANTLPLGIDTDLRPDPVEPFVLGKGDVFLLLSDGYIEAMDPQGGQFGLERTLEVVRANMQGTCAAMLEAVNAAARAFARGRPFGDDQTAVIIKRND
ncbi:MAG: PP2C family protein-serine/threonine phosphatase, partial [Phycisphaerales bacterium]